MTILKTHDLRKTYRRTKALDGVNLTIEKGDIYGFIGKNGAGKTTLDKVNPRRLSKLEVKWLQL
jgi:ABC-type multidrug transport system ATPase subunit